MAAQYFRLTAYNQAKDISVIMGSNGMYEKLWQFSAMVIQEGFEVLEVSDDGDFLDVNITKAGPETAKIIMRAQSKGRPENIMYKLNGITYRAVKVAEKVYIPDKNKTVKI